MFTPCILTLNSLVELNIKINGWVYGFLIGILVAVLSSMIPFSSIKSDIRDDNPRIQLVEIYKYNLPDGYKYDFNGEDLSIVRE